MRQLSVLFALILLLVIGGSLTYQISNHGSESLMTATRHQVDTPDASTLQVAPSQAGILVIVVFAALGGLVSMGVGLTVLFWFLHRSVVESKNAGAAQAAEANSTAAKNPA